MPLDAEFTDMLEDAQDDRKIKLRQVLKIATACTISTISATAGNM